MMLLWLFACHPPDPPSTRPEPTTEPAIQWVAEPILELPQPNVRLARELVASSSAPTSAVLTIDDGEQVREITFPGMTTEHRLPVLGLLADHTHALQLRLTDADGHTLQADLIHSTLGLDMSTPLTEVLQSDPARTQPGYTLCPVQDDGTSRLIAYDSLGRERWVQARVGRLYAFTIRPDGQVSALNYDTIELGDMLGNTSTSWGAANADVLIDELPVHHEIYWNDDGSFWTLTKDYLSVEEYPGAANDPYLFQPATIEADVAIRVLQDGTVAQRIEVAPLIGTQHATTSSNQTGLSGNYDWSHANAVWPLPDEDALLISLRHQDAIIKVDLSDESLVWLLARPEGWSDLVQDKLLTPIGSAVGSTFLWPTHSHAVMMVGDEVTLFDNGNDQRESRYVDEPRLGSFSRLVTYRIDDANGTVEQTWELRGPPDGPLFSKALGNADILENGNVFGTYSYLYKEGGVENADIGLGDTSIRLIEVDPATQEVAWEMRLTSDQADHPEGWIADRCVRVASLYAEGMETVR